MTKPGLYDKSKSYYSEAAIYKEFSDAEDFPGKIFTYLKPKVENKIILDLGCGNGKYLNLFAPYAKKITGIDLSPNQIHEAARKTKKYKNVNLICSSADKSLLDEGSVDLIYCCWVLGTIQNIEKRERIISETLKLLKKRNNGFYLIENDFGGEFEEIRGRVSDSGNKTRRYNEWLEGHGFKVVKRINTHFQFNNQIEAQKVIGDIWGSKVGEKIQNKVIGHRVVIFKHR